MHDVITVDTQNLTAEYSEQIRLCAMNSGCTVPNPRPRGRNTFLPVHEFPFEDSRRKRGKVNAIVEVAVEGGVKDITGMALRVESRHGGKITAIQWER